MGSINRLRARIFLIPLQAFANIEETRDVHKVVYVYVFLELDIYFQNRSYARTKSSYINAAPCLQGYIFGICLLRASVTKCRHFLTKTLITSSGPLATCFVCAAQLIILRSVDRHKLSSYYYCATRVCTLVCAR